MLLLQANNKQISCHLSNNVHHSKGFFVIDIRERIYKFQSVECTALRLLGFNNR